MKKKIVVVIAIMLALSSTALFTPEIQAQSELQKLQKDIDSLKANEKDIKNKANQTANKINKISSDIKSITKEINNLDLQLADTENKIALKEEEIEDTEMQAKEAAQLLDEAIARVEARDELLKKRVRAMYEIGEVSYLETLLDSKSIGDFLTRVDNIEKVVDSDKKILADNIADKEEIEARKLEKENFLKKLIIDYDELNTYLVDLESKRKQKTATIASLESQEEQLEKYQEELDAEILRVANEITKKNAEYNAELEKMKYAGGIFTWPLPGHTQISSNFGTRTDPFTKAKSTHNGTDIRAPQGTTIVAAADGVVIKAEEWGTYGNCVMIDHYGVVTLYAHIRHGGIKVKEGDKVKAGDKIAEVGSTGRSTGPHLHFSVIENGVFVEPMKYLKGK